MPLKFCIFFIALVIVYIFSHYVVAQLYYYFPVQKRGLSIFWNWDQILQVQHVIFVSTQTLSEDYLLHVGLVWYNIYNSMSLRTEEHRQGYSYRVYFHKFYLFFSESTWLDNEWGRDTLHIPLLFSIWENRQTAGKEAGFIALWSHPLGNKKQAGVAVIFLSFSGK